MLELEEQPQDLIIFGRSFLATTNAIINVQEGKIDLHLSDLVMKFYVKKMMKKPTIDD